MGGRERYAALWSPTRQREGPWSEPKIPAYKQGQESAMPLLPLQSFLPFTPLLPLDLLHPATPCPSLPYPRLARGTTTAYTPYSYLAEERKKEGRKESLVVLVVPYWIGVVERERERERVIKVSSIKLFIFIFFILFIFIFIRSLTRQDLKNIYINKHKYAAFEK